MATISKRGKKYRAQLYRKGKRESATFATKSEASKWALSREAELSGDSLPHKTLSEAFAKYADTISPEHRGEKWELLRLKALARFDMASKQIAKIGAGDIIEWRDARLESVSKATVLREMNLLRSVFEACRKEWRWIRENPMKDVTRPRQPPSRKRRITDDEINALIAVSGLNGAPTNKTQLTVHAFLFAIETAMRSGEILGMQWADISDYAVILPKTKNGDSREVPLSPNAIALLNQLQKTDKPYPITSGSRDAIFRRLIMSAKLNNLRFHDSRAEAIFRLSKKLDILELARCVGHRDIKSLMLYYRSTSKELADKLAK